VATWRKELHLAAVAAGSGGDEREHVAPAQRPAEAADRSRKASPMDPPLCYGRHVLRPRSARCSLPFFCAVLKKQEGFFVTAVRAGGRPSLPRRVRAGGPARGSDDGGADAGQLRRGAAGPAGGGGGGRRVHGGSGKRSSQGWPHLSLARPLGGGGSFGAPRACGRAPLPCADDVPWRCPFISRPPSPPRIKLAESIRSVCKPAEQSRACPLQHLATAVVIDSAYTGNGD